MIPMQKMVIQCNDRTFNELNVPKTDDVVPGIQLKHEAWHQFFCGDHYNFVILTGDNIMQNLANVISTAPIFTNFCRRFEIIGPNPQSFEGCVCKKKPEECKVLSYAAENKSGIHIYIDRRVDNSGLYNYKFYVVSLPGLTTEESAKKYQQVCQECAKYQNCAKQQQIKR